MFMKNKFMSKILSGACILLLSVLVLVPMSSTSDTTQNDTIGTISDNINTEGKN